MTEWQHYTCFFKKRLLDGTWASGRLMRRKVNGEWQYRKPTDEELFEKFSREAW